MTKENVDAHADARRRLMWAGLVASLAVLFGGKAQAKDKKAETPPDVQRLIDIEDIRQLKHKYFATTDAKDFTALRALYTDDATFGAGGLDSPEAFIKFLSSPERATRKTKHHGHNALITFTSATEAEGVWDYEAWTWQMRADGTLEEKAVRHNWGQYLDSYRKTPAGWRMTRMNGTLTHQG